jgi:hypothetical protein
MATAAAAPPMIHWALAVIRGIPPVLTLDLPVELLEVLDPELVFPLSPVVFPDVALVVVVLVVVVAAVEAMVLLPVAPGAAFPATMVTAWAPISVPKFEYWKEVAEALVPVASPPEMVPLQVPWSDVIWHPRKAVSRLPSGSCRVYTYPAVEGPWVKVKLGGTPQSVESTSEGQLSV